MSAASIRAYTRKSKQKFPVKLTSGVQGCLRHYYCLIGLIGGIVGFLAWAYQVIQHPPPEVCGSPTGSPVTMPRSLEHCYKKQRSIREREIVAYRNTHSLTGTSQKREVAGKGNAWKEAKHLKLLNKLNGIGASTDKEGNTQNGKN